MKQTSTFLSFSIIILFLAIAGCKSPGYIYEGEKKYGLEPRYGNTIPVDKPECAHAQDELTLTVHNIGKTGISNLKIITEKGHINFGGIRPGETTCAIPMPSFLSNPQYEIRISDEGLRSNYLQNESFGQGDNRLLTNGHYELYVHLEGHFRSLALYQFEIQPAK